MTRPMPGSLYRLDPDGPRLVRLGTVSGRKGEAYGICLVPAADGSVHAFSVLKEGRIEQVAVSYDGKALAGQPSAASVPCSQPEGCVVDTRNGRLFVGEEKARIWSFDARADGPVAGRLVARVDRKQLVPDVEGWPWRRRGADGGYLIASSQGDNAFALYRLPNMAPSGQRIARGKRLGRGDRWDCPRAGDFGPGFPGGLFVAQDSKNRPRAQNFKLVPWATVVAAVNPR